MSKAYRGKEKRRIRPLPLPLPLPLPVPHARPKVAFRDQTNWQPAQRQDRETGQSVVSKQEDENSKSKLIVSHEIEAGAFVDLLEIRQNPYTLGSMPLFCN